MVEGERQMIKPIRRYRPERHYMRGPGPKWLEKHGGGIDRLNPITDDHGRGNHPLAAFIVRGSMDRTNLIAATVIWLSAIGVLLSALPSLAVNAERPPSDRCIAVSKQEYGNAVRLNSLQTQFSVYARTGQLGTNHFWYCHL
jgi:hypothetical protein